MPVTPQSGRLERLFDSISSERSWAIRTRVFHYKVCLCDSWESCTAVLRRQDGTLLDQFNKAAHELEIQIRGTIPTSHKDNFVEFLRIMVHPREPRGSLIKTGPLDAVQIEAIAQSEPATLF